MLRLWLSSKVRDGTLSLVLRIWLWCFSGTPELGRCLNLSFEGNLSTPMKIFLFFRGFLWGWTDMTLLILVLSADWSLDWVLLSTISLDRVILSLKNKYFCLSILLNLLNLILARTYSSMLWFFDSLFCPLSANPSVEFLLFSLLSISPSKSIRFLRSYL